MGILLVGCGYWGQNWAKTLFRMGELQAICDPRPDVLEALKAQFPGIALYTDLSEVLQLSGVEAVVVATPVVTHRDIGRQCLLAGKSVLVEKPLALNPADAEELVLLARQSNLILAVGHLLLYQPALIKLKTMMREGVLGDILGVQCTRINLGKIRNEENVWWSLAPHDLSIIQMLLEEPLTVTHATKNNWLNRPGLEDAVSVTLSTASGKQASVHVSWLSPVKRHETMVIGTQGIAIFEDTLSPEQKLQLIPVQLDREADIVHGIQKREGAYVAYEPSQGDLLTSQAQGFLDVVRGSSSALPNNGENGYQVVKLLSKAQQLLEQSH